MQNSRMRPRASGLGPLSLILLMSLVTPDTLINQATMSKWGVDVGEVVLVIQKKGAGPAPQC